MTWTRPAYLEITGTQVLAIRTGLREQAFQDRQCFGCLTPLRDRTSTYCSAACRDEMDDPGDVDTPVGLVIVLHRFGRYADAAVA
jgi:hypothetical protein